MSNNNNGRRSISVTNLGASGTVLLIGIRASDRARRQRTPPGNTVGGSVANLMQPKATGAARRCWACSHQRWRGSDAEHGAQPDQQHRHRHDHFDGVG
ncbi:MAG: hypothetical protein IPO95_14355 [Rhodanobacteraceae bacterium]|nr:hypothetical protein [Rhodanobacteraceae bacterium]